MWLALCQAVPGHPGPVPVTSAPTDAGATGLATETYCARGDAGIHGTLTGRAGFTSMALLLTQAGLPQRSGGTCVTVHTVRAQGVMAAVLD